MLDSLIEKQWYIFKGGDLLVPTCGGGVGAPIGGGIAGGFPPAFSDRPSIRIPLADFSGCARVVVLEADEPVPGGLTAAPIRSSLAAMEVDLGARSNDLLRAYHGAQWKAHTRFCGKCGSPNADAPDEFARLCTSCGRREYPRLSPAVIVLVTDDSGRILLAHNEKFKNRMYSLLAGFVEMGESLESAVYREIQEEVGILVREPRYVASQPWPFPDSLMIGFRAKAAGGPLRPDGKEILDAQWFSRDSLPEIPGKGSLSRFLIDQWLAEADGESPR